MNTYVRFLLSLILVSSLVSQWIYAQQSAVLSSASTTTQPLEMGKPIEQMLKAGEIHSYSLTLEKGQFLDAAVNQRGIDVVVQIFGPDAAKLIEIDSPNEDQGDEPIALEVPLAGSYRIAVSALEKGAKPGRYEIRINAILTPQAYAARLAEIKRKQQVVIDWLKTNAIPLKTVEAGTGFADLQPLKNVLKNVRFIGLGEATHGTREFFQVKHRLLEFLVREMGYRVFALEGSYSALQTINDYVMSRMDDGTKALDGQQFAVWNTEEVRAMLDWARTYNASVSADKRVKFIGFDMQVNKPGKEKLLAYSKRMIPEWVTRLDSLFSINEETLFSTAFTQRNTDAGRAAGDTLKKLKAPYAELFNFLEANQKTLAAKSSQAEYEQMLEYARMLLQFIEITELPKGPAIRDRYMAENFTRLINKEPAGTRVVIWAHNGHIAADTASYRVTGTYLRQTYGSDYYALGLTFNQGSFQASGIMDVSSKRVMQQFTVKPAPEGSMEWYLAQTGIDKLIIDFRKKPQNPIVSTWLATPMPMWAGVGWYFNPEQEPSMFRYPYEISKSFDGLLFINTTTRARPNPSVKSDMVSTNK